MENTQTQSLSYEVRGIKDKQVISFESNDLDTVSDLMTEIIKVKNLDTNIKVIYSGKVLSHDTKLSDLNYKKGTYIVYLQEKKKPEEPKKDIEQSPQSAEPSQPAHVDEVEQVEQYGQSEYPNNQSPIIDNEIKNDMYAQAYYVLLQTIENTNQLADILNDKELINKMVQDKRISHTLAALSPELKKKIFEQNPTIKNIMDKYPNEANEIINDTEVFQKGEKAFSRSLQKLMNMGLGTDASQSSAPVDLTDAEAKDINEIIEITGSSEQEVMEVYIVCDKNKEVAINMLLN